MSDHAYWWIALGLGLVVAVVAVVLLEMFLRQVHRVERGAGLIWTAGKQVAGNTATTWLLPETSARLGALTDEAKLHVELLTRAAATKTQLRPSVRSTPVVAPTPAGPSSGMPLITDERAAPLTPNSLMSKALERLRRSWQVPR